MDKEPIISPLVFSDTRWSQTVEPPREVLVQWTGLHVNDTSWEDWDTLKSTYHFKDRVLLDQVGCDSIAEVGHIEKKEKAKRKRTSFQNI